MCMSVCTCECVIVDWKMRRPEDLWNRSAGWNSTRADGIFLDWCISNLASWVPRKSQCFSSNLKARKKANVWDWSQAEEFLSYCEHGQPLFGLSRPSADLMRPAFLGEGNLLYSEFTDLNVSVIWKHHHRPTIMLDQSIWTSHGPGKLIKWNSSS
jgi:hypothetical protein